MGSLNVGRGIREENLGLPAQRRQGQRTGSDSRGSSGRMRGEKTQSRARGEGRVREQAMYRMSQVPRDEHNDAYLKGFLDLSPM